jgi:hypothetical protein
MVAAGLEAHDTLFGTVAVTQPGPSLVCPVSRQNTQCVYLYLLFVSKAQDEQIIAVVPF